MIHGKETEGYSYMSGLYGRKGKYDRIEPGRTDLEIKVSPVNREIPLGSKLTMIVLALNTGFSEEGNP